MNQRLTLPLPRKQIDELLDSLEHKAKAETYEGTLCNKAYITIRAFLERDESAWLIESAIQDARGPFYLCVCRPMARFQWVPDHMRAIRFGRKIDAERVCDAVRHLEPELFPTIVPHPQAVLVRPFGKKATTRVSVSGESVPKYYARELVAPSDLTK